MEVLVCFGHCSNGSSQLPVPDLAEGNIRIQEIRMILGQLFFSPWCRAYFPCRKKRSARYKISAKGADRCWPLTLWWMSWSPLKKIQQYESWMNHESCILCHCQVLCWFILWILCTWSSDNITNHQDTGDKDLWMWSSHHYYPLPSGNLSHSYWKWWFIVDLHIENGDL